MKKLEVFAPSAVLPLFRDNRRCGGGRNIKQVLMKWVVGECFLLLARSRETQLAVQFPCMCSLSLYEQVKVVGEYFPYMGQGLDPTNQRAKAA
jgi:hypothetical protein